MVVIKIPYLLNQKISKKLSKGMGHTSYGEPIWPNTILYIYN